MTQINKQLTWKDKGSSLVDQEMGPEDTLSVEFDTPAGLVNGGQGSSLGSTEMYGDQPWNRQACISDKPGDFTPNTAGKHGTPTNFAEAFQPNFVFGPGGFNAAPGTKYYFNLKTVAASLPACGVRVTLNVHSSSGA